MLSVQELIKKMRSALTARLAEWNAKNGRAPAKRAAQDVPDRDQHRLFADSGRTVPPGDVEIHSESNDIAQPDIAARRRR